MGRGDRSLVDESQRRQNTIDASELFNAIPIDSDRPIIEDATRQNFKVVVPVVPKSTSFPVPPVMRSSKC